MNTLTHLLNPHHASFLERPRSLHDLLTHPLVDQDPFYDPYYAADGHSHRNLVAPRFDVIETEKAYFLEGDIAGVKHKGDVTVEWLVNRTLIVRGRILSRQEVEEVWDVEIWPRVLRYDKKGETEEKKEGEGEEKKEGGEEHHKKHEKERKDPGHECQWPRIWMTERRTGEFERSFTFSRQVDPDAMKAKLEAGLLMIMVPKKEGKEQATHRIVVE